MCLHPVAVVVPAVAQPGPQKDNPKAKKLIEWGWDEPDTKFMRQNVEKMEQFGIWMDHKKKRWEVADFSKNYFGPAEFKSAVRSALEVSDGYVWIYSERPKWRTNELLPKAYVEALVKARNRK